MNNATPLKPTPQTVKRTLIVFVKSPVPGDVKTRLIPFLTSLEAADLYKAFVCDIVRNVLTLNNGQKLLIAYQPHSKMPDLSWLGLKQSPDFFKQEGKSLGERLTQAFGTAFGKGAQHVLIIGSDSPTLPKAYIEQAYGALNDADVVIGPALDGGYYLIGLSRPCLGLFDDVSWSTDQVFERTTQNAQKKGCTLRVLPSHYDIDTVDDLMVLQKDLINDITTAPITKKLLTSTLKEKQLISR